MKTPACWSTLIEVPAGASCTAARRRVPPEGEVSLSRGETTVLEPATTRTWSALAIGLADWAGCTSTLTTPEVVSRPSETVTVRSRVPVPAPSSRTVTVPSLETLVSRPSPWAETR